MKGRNLSKVEERKYLQVFLLTHQFSNGGRLKNATICNSSAKFCIDNTDLTFVIVNSAYNYKMCVNIGPFEVLDKMELDEEARKVR